MSYRSSKTISALAIVSLLCVSRSAGAQALDMVRSFGNPTTDASQPTAGLMLANDGNFYGTTSSGGLYSSGTVFRITPGGALTVVHNFRQPEPAGWIQAPLIQAQDGRLYGAQTLGYLFRLNPDGTQFDYTGPVGSRNRLLSPLQASNLSLLAPYATLESTGLARVGIFSLQWGDPNVVDAVTPSSIVSATHTDGVVGPLVQYDDGNFYGTFTRAGAADLGVVFKMTPAGAFSVVHEFSGPDGSLPRGIIRGADGSFYGVTTAGGALSKGAVFRMTPAGAVTVLHSFAGGPDGEAPKSSLMQAADGSFYGTADGGSAARGVAYRITVGGTFTVLHAFQAGPSDGADPTLSTLVESAEGLLGTTQFGGQFGCGTVFRLSLSGILSVLHSFGPCDGFSPQGSLVQTLDGSLVGTTSAGGGAQGGTVFELAPSGTLNYVRPFGQVGRIAEATDAWDGNAPATTPLPARDGMLYGTTPTGGDAGGFGPNEHGVVYRVSPSGAVTILHQFRGTIDGERPRAPLMQASDGSLYGTTFGGGANGQGAVFRMTTTGSVTLLHSFTGSDGARPVTPPIESSNGNLYGTACEGGTIQNSGTLYRVTLGGTFTVIHNFAGGADGSCPNGLVLANDGNLYGTTASGSTGGTAFRLTPDGTLSTIHQFVGGQNDGQFPRAALIQASDGFLYGTTSGGGAWGQGTVFRMTPDGQVTVLASFNGHEGSGPVAAVMQAQDGNLYGMTPTGGASGGGVLFRVRLAGPPNRVDRLTASTTSTALIRLSWTPNATATSYVVKRSTASGGETTLATGLTSLTFTDTATLAHQRYYYTVTAVNASGESIDSYEVAVTAGDSTPGDFDGDRRADPTLYRSTTASWSTLRSTFNYAGISIFNWGLPGDVPVSGDFDGDALADIAIFRPSTASWWVLFSSTNYATYAIYRWGIGTDVPVPADYDGDGKTDIAVYRPSTGAWWILWSSSGYRTYNTFGWGLSGDVPVPADYDGDGKTDIAIYRPSTGGWWLLQSSTNFTTYRTLGWGVGGDRPVPGDYDGDGKADLAIYRPTDGTWWVLQSSSNNTTYTTRSWGIAGDVAAPLDFDGDGQIDLAVYRPSTGEWWVLKSSSDYAQYATYRWGVTGDAPVQAGP